MNRNIEIKARVRDLDALSEKARALSGAPPETLLQEDTFFGTKRGRLKLRKLDEKRGELIYYERTDDVGPCESRYLILPTREPDSLRNALAAALGVKGVVRKRRTVFHVGRTRVHLDEVDDLGSFVELEVVLTADEEASVDDRRVPELLAELGVQSDDLIGTSYIDLILTKEAEE